MLKRIFFAALFIAIWLPCLLFTITNATTQSPLPPVAEMNGPHDWKYSARSFDLVGLTPHLYLHGMLGKDGSGEAFTLDADVIEWMYSGKGRSSRHKVKKGPVFSTNISERPWVSQWDIDHDASMRFTLGGLRFNWHFLMGLFMTILLPPLFLLWQLAEDVAISTPQERKQRDENFLALVKAVEARAKGDPEWLKRRTLRLALLGYGVILGSILLMIPVGLGLGAAVLVLTGGNAAAAKLAFVLAAVPIGFAFILAKSLLMPRYDMPGVEIRQQDAPALFDFLNHIIKEAKGPRFARVYISNEMNASVSRHTGLLGFFGFGPVLLTLGLPLMQAVTKEQLGGVIGHEYGHVAAKDNALGQWIYRIRNSWMVLEERLQLEQLWYTLKLNRFYSWFIAVFSAYSFTLSRKCEYEADAFAAKLAGPQVTAAALSTIAVRADEGGDKYWRDVWKLAESSPDISGAKPYSRMAQHFATQRERGEIVAAILREKTGYASTHPSTLDRVAALGQSFAEPAPLERSAARELLGPLEEQLAQRFDTEWEQAASEQWKFVHEDFLALRARLAELKAKPVDSLTREELTVLANAAGNLREDETIILASEEMLRRAPDDTEARLNIAILKLEKGDESMLRELEEVAKRDPQLLLPACSQALAYLHKNNRADDAKPFEDRLSAWEYEREAAAQERGLVLWKDNWLPHGLPADTTARLAEYCAQFKSLHTVYLAQKKVAYMPEYPSYLVAFRLRYQPFKSQKKLQEEINAFFAHSGLDGSYVFIEATGIKDLEGKLKKIAGAQIYSVKK
ncbi:MAG: M48 family metalloprotease [Alphaproteobacteria bacterium]